MDRVCHLSERAATSASAAVSATTATNASAGSSSATAVPTTAGASVFGVNGAMIAGGLLLWLGF